MRVSKIVFVSMLTICFAQGEKSMQEITKDATEMKGDSRIFSGAKVHFNPKARTAWHTHPAG